MKNIIKIFSISAASYGSKISCRDVVENLKAAGLVCEVVENEVSLKSLSGTFHSSLVYVGIKDMPE